MLAQLAEPGGECVRDEQKTTCARTAARDISARKQAMDELSESEERFSKAFRASPYFMLISSLDNGQMLDVNDAFVNTTGFNRDEVLAMTAQELGLLGRGEQQVQLQAKFAEHGGLREEECDLVVKSGETITCLLSTQQIAITGQDCVIWQAVDATERRKAEEALSERERLLHAILLPTGADAPLREAVNQALDRVATLRLIEADWTARAEACDAPRPPCAAASTLPA